MPERRTRREFMGITLAGLAGSMTSTVTRRSVRASLAIDPEQIVLNARIHTMDAAMPRAEAFAVSGGR